MEKLMIVLLFLLSYIPSKAQDQLGEIIKTDNSQIQNVLVNNKPKYQLFPTQNRWTFIKLNTRNGEMDQVQYDIEGDNRFETYLNMIPLVIETKEENGRFTLYPTQNMWTFILLDQIDGRAWQVQWAIEAKNRGVIPIN